MKTEAMNHRSLVVTPPFFFKFIQQSLASLLGTNMFQRASRIFFEDDVFFISVGYSDMDSFST